MERSLKPRLLLFILLVSTIIIFSILVIHNYEPLNNFQQRFNSYRDSKTIVHAQNMGGNLTSRFDGPSTPSSVDLDRDYTISFEHAQMISYKNSSRFDEPSTPPSVDLDHGYKQSIEHAQKAVHRDKRHADQKPPDPRTGSKIPSRILAHPNTNATLDFSKVLFKTVDDFVKVRASVEENLVDYEPDMINPHNFSYIINERDICSRQRPHIFALIFVHTSPNHFRHRAIIRKTWGHSELYEKLKTVTIFVMGKPTNVDEQRIIFLESERYRDIIQEDFLDSYKNLTYKAIAGFKWVTKFCMNAKYVVKSDDDMFLNVFNLVRHLRFFVSHGLYLREIICLVWNGMPVLRDKNSKWYVSKNEFENDTFPTYCSGSAYVLPIEIIPLLYNVSFYTRFLWVDDAYASGSLAQAAKIRHKDISELYILFENEFQKKLINGDAVFAHMSGNDGLSRRLMYWKKVVQKEEGTLKS